MNEPGVRGKRGTLVLILILVISAVWIYSGISKMLDLPEFSETVRVHGLIGDGSMWLTGAVPAAEVLLGIALLIGPGFSRLFGLFAMVVSALGIGLLSVYIWNIDDAVIEQVGCGCHGQTVARVISGVNASAKAVALGMNTVFALLHVPLLLNSFRPALN